MSFLARQDRGPILLTLLFVTGICIALAHFRAPKISTVKPCLIPAIDKGVLNCEGKGLAAEHLFILMDTKINLNHARADQLSLIPKLQKKTALAITAAREEIGKFTSFEQLDAVKGVGPKTLENLRKYATLSP